MAEAIAVVSLAGGVEGIEEEPGLARADYLLDQLKRRVSAAHALEKEGWDVGVSDFMGPVIRAHGRLATLEQALESATRCGVPPGTAVEWCQPPKPDQRPLAFGGGFVAGPVFGPGRPEEILVCDPYGRESLHPTREEALRILRVVIRDYAERVAELYPDAGDLADGVHAHAEAIGEDDLHGLWLGLVRDEILNETIVVKAMVADHFRWGGFQTAVDDSESPDRLANTVALSWGPLALELALEGWRLANADRS